MLPRPGEDNQIELTPQKKGKVVDEEAQAI
jgi:hypothetical protein